MARSSYIYAVLDLNNTGDPLVAAFTVRHELVTWLGRQDGMDHMNVVRVPDGCSYLSERKHEHTSAREYWEKFK